MKIKNLSVEELQLPNGIYAKPWITLDLQDYELDDADAMHIYDSEHREVGGGVRYSFLADMYVFFEAQHSIQPELNSYFKGKQPWIPVRVNNLVPMHHFYIPLDRARRELARHAPGWELVVDDHWAVEGHLVWRLREKELRCKAAHRTTHDKQKVALFCNDRAVHEIRRADHYIPLCRTHLNDFTAAAALRRVR